MKRLVCLGFLTIFAPFAVACGSTSVNALGNGNPDGGNGNPNGGSDPNGTGNSDGTPAGCGNSNATSISGTWNIIGSATKSTQSSKTTLTIDADTFTFTNGLQSLRYHADGNTLSLQFLDNDDLKKLKATHGGTYSLNGIGVIPLPVEGDWTFGSNDSDKFCTWSLNGSELTAGCNGVRGTPVGEINRTIIGERTQVLTSAFGMLSGKWHLSSKELTIDVTFNGNSFTATTSRSGTLADTVTFNVCNGTASGTTSRGYEFAGTRE
jgi:hypothetical protein